MWEKWFIECQYRVAGDPERSSTGQHGAELVGLLPEPGRMTSHATFVTFGTDHVQAMALIAVVAIGFPLAVRRAGSAAAERWIAIAIGVALPVYECLKIFIRVVIYDYRLAEQLPFHLCSLALLLVAYMLIRRNYLAFEIAYFWALGGTLQAILTPDLRDGFPSLAFVTFFTGHGLVILGVTYALIVFRFRPTLASAGKTALATLAYLPIAAVINMLLDTNFLYLSHKPAQASVLDFLGPWPWYIVSLIALGAVICAVLYLPFALLDYRRRFTRQEIH